MSEAHKTGIFSSKGAEAPDRIIGIQFSMLSPEEIRKSSVAEITSRDTYVNNRPVIGGLFDPRMGVLEPGLICPTDGLNYMQTPGYFGHIELARPVYYIQYLTQLMKTLRCICFRCSKLLISKEQHRHILEWDAKKRWEYVFTHANSVKRCGDENDDGCGCQQPDKIYKEGLATLFAKWKFTGEGDSEENTKIVKVIPEIALKILGRMTDDDIQFMGYSPVFSRPESMICQVLAVPPPAVRPSVKHDAQQRSEDDLTHILVSVVKANRTLQEKMTQTDENGHGVDPKLIDDWTTVLQYFVATMVNNKLPGVASITQRSGRAFKSIIERLNGKHGRVRGNLMGKRVDFSARSVITPDANLSIRQLGVPMKIAMNLTQPVVVNSRNRAFLNQLVINGPEVYPGAKILEKKNGDNISLRHVDRESLVLDNGDTVHRHMMDGDIMLFNRQPTLHRMSMMGHEVKVMREGNTFRMNVADTKPYNADFDGDEMNLHAPQDEEAAAELRNLAAVPRQMISPANNSSIVGIFQDSLLGAYRFTREGIQFTPRQAMNLLMCFPGIQEEMFVDPERNVSNFEILSQFLPAMSSYFTNGGFEEGENKTTSNNVIDIKNGQYLRGQLDKGALGSGSKGLIQRIFNDFGFQKSADFIDYLQGIVNEYMKQSGYSVGISDLIADPNTNRKIADAITRQKQEAMNIIQELHVGVFENNTGKTNYEEFETRMNGILNKAREEGGKIGRKSLSKDNRFVIMVNAGSKGNNLNIVQMISCLGQQNVDGKRIPYGLEARTLPHYPKYDDSPSARGFVETSFVQGLSPQELFFHAMGGREGLIDTAVKTSKTGYIQRRLIKGLEDMKVAYDMTVRNAKNKIVQFAYGDDGMDSTKVENQVLPLTHMSIEQIYAHFLIPEGTKSTREMIKSVFTSDAAKRIKKESKEYNKSMKQLIDEMIIIRDTMHTNVFERMNDKKVHYPIHLHAILRNVEQQLHLTSTSQSDLTLLDALRMVDEEFNYLNSSRYTKPTLLFKALFYYYLNPKELLVIRRFHRQGLQTLLLQIRTTYMRSVVAPGEMVGLVAAQSIGEPTTQLTLNSFVYETMILVRNKQKEIKQIQIGDFVKYLCEHSIHNQEYYREKDTTYAPVQKEDFWEIQAPDKYGNIDWYKIEAGTKHPVINKDGTNTMLKVITEDGQEVVATKAKSFLLLKNGQLEPTRGDELNVGDYVPVSIKTISHKENYTLKIGDILSKKKYLFGSEASKAMSVWNESFWWKKYNNVKFTVPYSRSDTFRHRMHLNETSTENVFIEYDKVYPKKTWKKEVGIPEKIKLDYNFGYLIGAYCAEGCLIRTQISIANNEYSYFEPIISWCKQYGITIKHYTQHNKNREGWTSSNIRIYSIVLRDLLYELCGKYSNSKYVHNTLKFSNDEFKNGFITSYYNGDGRIDVKTKSILATSVSKQLLNDINTIQKTIGIYSHIRKNKKITQNNIGTKKENIKQSYTITTCNNSMKILCSILELNNVGYKYDDILKLCKYTPQTKLRRQQIYIPNLVNGKLIFEKRNDNMKDVIFVKVKTIEEVNNTTDYAYDLTVDKVRTFVSEDGLCLQDTFHFSGISSKSGVTRGVPRIEEILSLSENPKNPSMTVYLKEEEQEDQERVMELMHRLEHTSLRDVTSEASIYFDPNDENTRIEEDAVLMKQYNDFKKIAEDCMETSSDDALRSKWVIRFKIDREQLLERNITMDDIYISIQSAYKDDIDCIYSDMNANNLIMRVRTFQKGTKTSKIPIDTRDEIYKLKSIQDMMLDGIILRGIRGIGKVMIRKIPGYMVANEGGYESKDIWVLDTMGTNLMDILANPEIDTKRTLTNDLMEIYRTLGIEAVRQVIYNEFAEVLGGYINYHHLSMLCDRMTMNAKPTSIFRHGINNDDIGTLAKASLKKLLKCSWSLQCTEN